MLATLFKSHGETSLQQEIADIPTLDSTVAYMEHIVRNHMFGIILSNN